MTDQELRQAILQYFEECCERGEEAPSLRKTFKRFRKEKLNNVHFYKLFPGGLAEACKLAGVPVPKKRISRVRKAVEASRMKDDADETLELSSLNLTLTGDLTKRLLGVSHLERGKDPSLIIEELLDRDAKLRKNYKLSLANTKAIGGFLDLMTARKWKVQEAADVVTRLWNCGFFNLDLKSANRVISFVKDLNERKWEVNRFIDVATEYYSDIYYFDQYKLGNISREALKARLKR